MKKQPTAPEYPALSELFVTIARLRELAPGIRADLAKYIQQLFMGGPATGKLRIVAICEKTEGFEKQIQDLETFASKVKDEFEALLGSPEVVRVPAKAPRKKSSHAKLGAEELKLVALWCIYKMRERARDENRKWEGVAYASILRYAQANCLDSFTPASFLRAINGLIATKHLDRGRISGLKGRGFSVELTANGEALYRAADTSVLNMK